MFAINATSQVWEKKEINPVVIKVIEKKFDK
jgi:hypothetical protein